MSMTEREARDKAAKNGGEAYRTGSTIGRSRTPAWGVRSAGSSSGSSSSGGSSGLPSPSSLTVPTVTPPPVIKPEETLQSILQFAPQLASQQWNEMQKYEPLRAALALDLAKQRPQQLSTELGLAQQYMPQFQDLQLGLIDNERRATLGSMLELAPQLQGIRSAAEDPQTTALRNELLGLTLADLQAGSRLTPGQGRVTDQNFRAAEQVRGLEGGGGSSARETVNRALSGLNVQQQRMATAQNVLGQEYSQAPNPFALIGGMPTPATAQAQAQYGAGLMLPTLAGMPVQGQNNSINAVSNANSIYNQSASNNLAGQQANAQMQQYSNSLQYLPWYNQQLYGQ